MDNIKSIMDKKKSQMDIPTVDSNTVYSGYNYSFNNSTGNSMNQPKELVKNSTSNIETQLNKFLEGQLLETDFIAKKLASELNDMPSLPHYKLLSKEHSVGVLLDALSYTLEAFRAGRIKTTRAKYFMSILLRKGLKIKFKTQSDV